MKKIDRRKTYYTVLDVETANSSTPEGKVDPSSAQTYDIGFAIVDRHGKIYEERSFVNRDVWERKEMMNSAYYADKIPKYEEGLAEGTRVMSNTCRIKQELRELCEEYNVRAIVAHNARFDVTALNATQRYMTASKYRFFLPYGIPVWDSMKMAGQTICKQKAYRAWCEKNGYMTKNHQPRKTAEILYRYITNQEDFEEEHTGLEDVKIESVIFAHCLRQHKKMNPVLGKRG